MHLSKKDKWYLIGIVVIVFLLWIYLYNNQKLDKDLPDSIKKVTIDRKINQLKSKIIRKDMDNNDVEYTRTNSGLEYRVIRMGDGPKPICNSEKCDTVEVHYEGRLENGQIFDSSYERNQTISFPLNKVISGWTEGLQLMPVGSEFEFRIPPELAYGNNELPGIPAGSTLIFKVELFGIQ